MARWAGAGRGARGGCGVVAHRPRPGSATALRFRFVPHLIETELPTGDYDRATYAQTALADLDRCGRPEYIVGNLGYDIYAYKYHSPDRWERFSLTHEAPRDVGLCVLDVDGDGWPDLVTGSSWYRSSRDLTRPFQKIPFDPMYAKAEVHDVVAWDMDGDGRMEIVTMSDEANLHIYRIPADPTGSWDRYYVGPAVHTGVAVGDLDGDGLPDIARTDTWFRNPGKWFAPWAPRLIGPNTYPPPDYTWPWAFNGTFARVCDMNRDGRNDIVFTDAEIPGGRIWWMENVDGSGTEWRRHEVPNGDARRRGAYHSLYVGDLDGDGDLDIFSCEMEDVRGDGPPRWYVWENLDGFGVDWREHVILDANLGGHAAVVGDVTGNGLPDIIAKPWKARKTNALGGKQFVMFLENVSER